MIEPVVLEPETMFRGKQILEYWLERYQCETMSILNIYGREKFEKVYYWLLRYLSGMKWGQWMVVNKIAPDPQARRLFYYCMELIYQSDLLSQFCFEKNDSELRIYMVEPTEDEKKKKGIFYGNRTYLLIDWYTRIKLAQETNLETDIDPSLFGFVNENENENQDENQNENYNDN